MREKLTPLIMATCAACSGQFSWDVQSGDPPKVRCLKGLADSCGVAKLATEKTPKTLPTLQDCLDMAQKAQTPATPKDNQ